MFRTSAKPTKRSTQAYLDIAAIKNGVVILRGGGLRAILGVSSVNFALKSPEEQEDIVLRYQGFLNSLHFPIQIVMQSRKLDLADYLVRLRAQAENQPNDQIRAQTSAYAAFMEQLLAVANIMEKRFYLAVTYDPDSLKSRGFFDRLIHPTKQVTVSMTEAEFAQYSAQLGERAELVASGMASMGLHVGRLETKEIIELLYATYNPEEAVRERLGDVTTLAQVYIGDEAATPASPEQGVKGEETGALHG